MQAFEDFLAVNPELRISRAGLDAETRRMLLQANKGMRTLADIEYKCGVLYDADENVRYDPDAVKKVLAKGENAGYEMLKLLLPQLEAVQSWTTAALEAVITKICESHSVNMGKVAQPIRVAVTGGTVSPAIYDTLVLLGKEKTVKRIQHCLSQRAQTVD